MTSRSITDDVVKEPVISRPKDAHVETRILPGRIGQLDQLDFRLRAAGWRSRKLTFLKRAPSTHCKAVGGRQLGLALYLMPLPLRRHP
jgi:hypothetical protein